jgi:hypothetical protein
VLVLDSKPGKIFSRLSTLVNSAFLKGGIFYALSPKHAVIIKKYLADLHLFLLTNSRMV